MPTKRILGLDPGLANFGMAIVDVEDDGTSKVVDMTVIRTKKVRGADLTDDLVRRLRQVSIGFNLFVMERIFDSLAAEAFSVQRNAKTAATWGIIASYAAHLSIPIVQPTPQAIKKAICGGSGKVTKKQVENELASLYGSRATRGVLRKRGVAEGAFEHAFDALGAILATIEADTGRLFRGVAS